MNGLRKLIPTWVGQGEGAAGTRMVAALSALDQPAELFERPSLLLPRLEKAQPSLLLIPMEGSEIRGDELCRRLKEQPHTSQLPVVVYSASNHPHHVMYCWRAGADDFLGDCLHEALTELLPSKLQAIGAASEALPSAEAVQQRTVLIVEPSRFHRNVIRANLEQAGLWVLTASEGAEALDLLAEAPRVDLCLVDIALPGEPVLEVVEAIRAHEKMQGKKVLLMADKEHGTPSLQQEQVLNKKALPVELILRHVFTAQRPHLAELHAAERVPFFSAVHFRTGQGEWLSGFTYDVSESGLFVRTLTVLPVDAPVELKFTFAGQREPAVCRGLVAWANPYRQGTASAPVGMGIHLTEIHRQLQQQVLPMVEKAKARAMAIPLSSISPTSAAHRIR